MSTANRRPRRLAWFFAPVAALGLGCSSTRIVRPDLAGQQPQTIVSENDRPLPAVTGEPGLGVSDDVAPEPRARADAENRISGRVVDDRGAGVGGATVRLAEGSTPGGRVVKARTDPSGGFTLRNVSRGAKYTVVAEDGDGQEARLGYADARAPETDLVIRIGRDEGNSESPAPRRARRTRSAKPAAEDAAPDGAPADRVSARDPVDAPRARSRANAEDIPLAVADEPDEPAPASRRKAAAVAVQGTGWRRGDSASSPPEDSPGPAPRGDLPGSTDEEDDRDPHRRTASRPARPAADEPEEPRPAKAPARRARPALDDEEVNPLPPARPRATPAPAREPADDPAPAPDASPRPAARATNPEDDALGARDVPEPRPDRAAMAAVAAAAEVAADPAAKIAQAFARPARPQVVPAARADPPARPDPGVVEPAGRPRVAAVASAASPRRDAPEPPAPAPVAEPDADAGDLRPEPFSLFSSAPRITEAEPRPAPMPAQGPAPEAADVAPTPEAAPEPAMTTPPAAAVAEAMAAPSAPGGRPMTWGDLDAGPGDGPPGPAASPRLADEPPASRDPAAVPVAGIHDPSAPAVAPADGAPPALDAGGPTPPDATPPVASASAPPAAVPGPDAPPAAVAADDGPPALFDTAPTPGPRAAARPKAAAANPSRSAKVAADADPRGDAGPIRVIDFPLPDLQGRPFRFRDFNSDFVIIDFWGTWCAPCLNSMPRLVELQRRYGTDTLRVVGIACEKGPMEDREGRIMSVLGRLSLGFPILMDDYNHPSPLQTALKVTKFPTMVLLDREGTVLWRGDGISPLTMASLDHAVARAVRSSGGTRANSSPRR